MRTGLTTLLVSLIGLVATSCTEKAPPPPPEPSPVSVLMTGGNASHDFDRWFNQEDGGTLRAAGATTSYTEDMSAVLPALADSDILFLSNNQPMTDPALRKAIFDHSDSGKGMMIMHPSTWYNWEDWPEYNKKLVGGGSKSHGPYGPFEVTVTNKTHPLAARLPATFTVEDELYRWIRDESASPINVIAIGTEPDTGTTYPIAWTVNSGGGKIFATTLGHDEFTHTNAHYQTLITNALKWVQE